MLLTSTQEIACFGKSVLLGILCSVIFDFVMSLKKDKTFIFDTFLWTVTGFAFWFFWQKFFFGKFAWHTVVGFVTSSILYFFTAHKFIYFIFCFIRKKICSFFYFIYKNLLTESGFFGKIRLCMSEKFFGEELKNSEGKNYEKTKN